MKLTTKVLLVLAVAILPASLWLGGDWWKWVATAVALILAAAIIDQPESTDTDTENRQ